MCLKGFIWRISFHLSTTSEETISGRTFSYVPSVSTYLFPTQTTAFPKKLALDEWPSDTVIGIVSSEGSDRFGDGLWSVYGLIDIIVMLLTFFGSHSRHFN